jgi:hypothetical protein
VPIVPVSLIGTRDIKQPGSLWINYGVQVRVIISSAVEVDGLGKKKQIFTTEKIRNLIAYNLDQATSV